MTRSFGMRHKNVLLAAMLVGLAATAWNPTTHAQEHRYREYRVVRPHPAPADAFELQVGTGYTQGFGSAGPAMGLPSIAGPGVAADLDASYRATPYWSVGVQGEYAQYAPQRDTAARSATVNLGVTYHLSPFRRAEPWLRLGTGWRWLWSPAPDVPSATLQGWQAIKANLGYDVRLSDGVAISPQIGADLTVFSWLNQGGYSGTLATSNLGVFIEAGVQGRFDIGSSATPAYVGSAR